MARELRAGHSVSKSLRRLVRHQLTKVLDELSGQSGHDTHERIHEVRKRIKTIRAMIQFSRNSLGRKLAHQENARFRDLARPLSEVRDACVLVETLDRLIGRHDPLVRTDGIKSLRRSFVRSRRDVARRVLEQEATLSRIAPEVEKARQDVKHWEFAQDGWAMVKDGLEEIYRRGCETFQGASVTPDDEHLHDWRKQVKNLGYTLEILTPIRPGYIEGLSDEADKLSDLLGDDHDLAVLRERLANVDEETVDSESLDVIRSRIATRRIELQREAFAIGRGIYGEDPTDFVHRFRVYWRAWKSEAEAASLD